MSDTKYSMPMSQKDCKTNSMVTVTSVAPGETPVRPLYGRRRTTTSFGSPEAKPAAVIAQDDPLSAVGNFLLKVHQSSAIIRFALYVLPVAGLLAIPLALFDTIYKDAKADNVRLLGLFIWLETIWVGIWVCKLCAKAMPVIWHGSFGQISTGARKYSLVLANLEIPLSFFMWSIVAWATLPLVCVFNKKHCSVTWITKVRTGMVATIVVAAIFLVHKFIIQLVSMNYHRKQFHLRIKENKRTISILDHMYDASRTLFPPFCPEFMEEDYMIQDPEASDLSKTLNKAGLNIGLARDKFTAAFGNMASELAGKRVFNPTAAHSVVIAALETKHASKALARRIWLSFVSEGKDALYKQDIIDILGAERADEAEEIFDALDQDGNGDVSLDEMTMLVVEVGQDRKSRAQSMHDIDQAIAVLDNVISFAVLVLVGLVYAAFFSKTLATKTIWSTFTGLAFAIGGTVTEFLSCCIFLFAKHPYDVGDRVDFDKAELIVEHISLMYSVFRRVDSDKRVQIPHSVCNGLWIDNVTRSKAMKERLSLQVSAHTTTADILGLRGELETFIQAADNKRDFQPGLDIELISVGDMKQLELRVEIRHKSNFSNELLRSMRRNKFMCELLASMRRIGIEAPGSGPKKPAEADKPSDDALATTITDKLPIAAPTTSLQSAISTAIANPAMNMIASVTGRRGSAVSYLGGEDIAERRNVGRRRSQDNLRISLDDSRRMQSHDPERARSVQHGPVTYLPRPNRNA